MEIKTDKSGRYLHIEVYTQLADNDWKELKRAANKQLKGLEPKTTWQGDDLKMLATLANLARDARKNLSYGELSSKLADLGYLEQGGGMYTDDAIDKKLQTAYDLGF